MADPVSKPIIPTPLEEYSGLREKLSEECRDLSQNTTSLNAGQGHKNLGVEIARGTAEGVFTFGFVTEGFTDVYHLSSLKFPGASGEQSQYYAQAGYAKAMEMADPDHMNLCGEGLKEIRGKMNLGSSFLRLGAAASSIPLLVGLGDEAYQHFPEESQTPFANLEGPARLACDVLNQSDLPTSDLSSQQQDQLPDQIALLKGAIQVARNENTNLNMALAGQHPNNWIYDYARPLSGLAGVGMAFSNGGSETIKGLYGAYIRRPFLQGLIVDPLNDLKKAAEKRGELELAKLVMAGSVRSCDQSEGKQDALKDWAKEVLGEQTEVSSSGSAPTERSYNPNFNFSPVLAVGPTTETLVPGARGWFWDGFPGVTTRLASWLGLDPVFAGGIRLSDLDIPDRSGVVARITPRDPILARELSVFGNEAPISSSKGPVVENTPGVGGIFSPKGLAVGGALGIGLTTGVEVGMLEAGYDSEESSYWGRAIGLLTMVGTGAYYLSRLKSPAAWLEAAQNIPGFALTAGGAAVSVSNGRAIGNHFAQDGVNPDPFLRTTDEKVDVALSQGAGGLAGVGLHYGLTRLVGTMAGGFVTLLNAALTYGNGNVVSTSDIESDDLALTSGEEVLKDQVMDAVFKDVRVMEEASKNNDARAIHDAENKIMLTLYNPSYAAIMPKVWSEIYNGINNTELDLGQYGRIGDMYIGSQEEALARVASVKDSFDYLRQELTVFGVSSTEEQNLLQAGNSLGSEESVCTSTEEEESSSVDTRGFDIYPTSDTSETSDMSGASDWPAFEECSDDFGVSYIES